MDVDEFYELESVKKLMALDRYDFFEKSEIKQGNGYLQRCKFIDNGERCECRCESRKLAIYNHIGTHL